RAGHPEHSRGNVGVLAVRVDSRDPIDTQGTIMEATLDAVKRSTTGKNAKNEARRLRAAGSVPAVVYGARTGDSGPTSLPVSVDPKSLLRILHSGSGANTLIRLRLDGVETPVLVKEYQLDPISHR